MRVAMAFAVVGICTVLALWILGIVGASDAFEGTLRTVALVTVGAGGAFALFALLNNRPRVADSQDSANGPRF